MPPIEPTLGPESGHCVTRQHFSKLVSGSKTQTTLFRRAAADVVRPPNICLLPPDVPPLVLELFEELVDAFVGVHVLLRREEKPTVSDVHALTESRYVLLKQLDCVAPASLFSRNVLKNSRAGVTPEAPLDNF